MENNNEIIGPSADERDIKLKPESVSLADGSPLYHALLSDPNALVLSQSEAQEAKSRLSVLIEADPKGILSCQGKTLQEAKKILESIEANLGQKAA